MRLIDMARTCDAAVAGFIADAVQDMQVAAVCRTDDVDSWNIGRWLVSIITVFLPPAVALLWHAATAGAQQRVPISRRGPIMAR